MKEGAEYNTNHRGTRAEGKAEELITGVPETIDAARIEQLNLRIISKEDLTTIFATVLTELNVPTAIDVPTKPDLSGVDKKLISAVGAKVEEAEEYYKELLDDLEVYLKLANVSFQEGAYERALEYCNKAIDVDPNYEEVWYDKAIALEHLTGERFADPERTEEAIECYRKATAINPGYKDAWRNLGNALGALSMYDEAQECYAKAMEIDSSINLWYERGDALYHSGKYKEAIECFDKAIELNPEHAEAYIAKADVLCVEGLDDQALEYYDKAIELIPQPDEVLCRKGYALDRLGRFRESLKCFEMAVIANPNNAEAWYSKATALYDVGDYKVALRHYDKVTALADDFRAWLNKGNIYFSDNKFEKAIKCYEKVIQLNPTNVVAWHQKGICLAAQGKYREAVECYDKTMEINPNLVLWYDKGEALKHQGKYQEAMECYDKSIECKVDMGKAWCGKGSVLALEGKYEEALKCLDTSIKIDRFNMEPWHLRGNTLFNLGDYGSALASFEEALSINNKSPQAWLDKGKALFGLYNYKEATKCFEQVLRLEPGNEEARKLLDIIKTKEKINQVKAAIEDKDYVKVMEYADITKELMESAKEPAQQSIDTINASQTLLEFAEKLEADVTSAKELIVEARAALVNSEFEKALECAKLAMDELAEPLQELVTETISASQRIIDRSDHLELSSLQELINKAKRAMEDKDYIKAFEYAEESRSELEKLTEQRREISNAIQLAKGKLDAAREMNIDTAKANIFLNLAQKALDEENYEKAWDYVSQTTREVERLEGVRKKLLESIISIQATIRDLGKRGVDIADADEALQRARETFETGDYDTAEELARKAELLAKESKHRHLPVRAADALSAAQSAILEVKELDMDISNAEKLIQLAESAFEVEDYAIAEKIAKKAEALVNDAKERYLPLRASDAISTAGSILAELKSAGTPVDGLLSTLQTARDALSAEKYEEAERIANKVESAAKTLREELTIESKVKKTLQTVNNIVDELKGFGADTASLEELVQQAVTYLESREFADAEDYATRAEQHAADAKRSYLAQRATAVIAYVRNILIKAKERGAEELPEPAEALAGAGEAFVMGEYDKAGNLAIAAEDAVKDTVREYLSDELVDTIKADTLVQEMKRQREAQEALTPITEAREHIVELQELGVDVSTQLSQLLTAGSAYVKGDYASAARHAETAKASIEHVKSTQLGSIAGDAVLAAGDAIKEAKKYGTDVHEAEKLFKQAEEAYEKADFINALKYTKEATMLANELFKDHFMRRSSRILVALRRTIKSARAIGVDVAEAKKLYKRAKEAVEEGDYDTALEHIKNTEKLITELKHRTAAREAPEILSVTHTIVGDVRDIGADVTEAESLLLKAVEALEAKDFENTILYAKRAQRSAEESRKRYLPLKIRDAISTVRYLITEVKVFGLDTTDVDGMIDSAEEFLNAEDYEKAEEQTEKAKEFVTSLKKDYLARRGKERYTKRQALLLKLSETIYKVGVEISKIRDLGIDVGEQQELVTQAKACFEREEYNKAKDLVVEARRALEPVMEKANKVRKQRTLTAIRLAWTRLREARDLGMDVTRATALLDEARTALLDQNFDKAMGLVKQSLARMKTTETQQQQLLRKLENVIEAISKEIEESRAAGLEVEGAEELIARARDAFEAKEFNKARDLATEARTMLKSTFEKQESVKRAEVAAEIQAAWAAIKEAEERGIDASTSKDLIDIARNAMLTKEFRKAMVFAKQSAEKLRIAEEMHTSLTKEIEMCEERINKLREEDIFVGTAEDMLERAKVSLKNRRYNKVSRLLTALKQSLDAIVVEEKLEAARRKEEAAEIIKTTWMRIQQARGEGVDASQAEELLNQAREVLKNRDYKRAIELAKEGMERVEAKRQALMMALTNLTDELEGIIELVEATRTAVLSKRYEQRLVGFVERAMEDKGKEKRKPKHAPPSPPMPSPVDLSELSELNEELNDAMAMLDAARTAIITRNFETLLFLKSAPLEGEPEAPGQTTVFVNVLADIRSALREAKRILDQIKATNQNAKHL